MRFTISVGLLLIFQSTSVFGQLPTFSSFWLSPQLAAPTAMAGNDAYQVSAHYRRQAFGESFGYRSMLLSAQLPLYYQGKTQFGTLGLNLMQDESGTSFLFSTTGLLFSYLYDAVIADGHHLVAGTQAGYFRRGIDWSNVTTNNQYVDGHFDPSVGAGEPFPDEKSYAFTTNVGLAYYFADEKGNPVIHVGAGLTNINGGSFTYLSDQESQVTPKTFVAYSHFRVFSNSDYELVSDVYWRNENEVNDLIGGFQLRKGTKPRVEIAENHLGVGLYYTRDHTGIIALQLIQPNWLFGISYDLMFGDKPLRNTQNAVEVTVGWRAKRVSKEGKRNSGGTRRKLPWNENRNKKKNR